MGLAASQARFLAITARKMNCEFQSMQIAQEKLSVTRDMQKAAQNYQTALDATKLVWDCDNDVYDLTYGVMMTPSMLNEFTPYLITDISGKVVLTDNMFLAAVNAGIIDANGDPTGRPMMLGADSDKIIPYYANIKEFENGNDNTGNDRTQKAGENDGSRNAFLYQLSQSNQISGATVDAILRLGVDGYTRSGIGGEIFDKSKANALSTPLFIDYLKETTYADAGYGNNISSLKSGFTPSYDILYSADGTNYLAGNVKVKSGEALTQDMNVKKISYTAGQTLDRNVVVKVPAGGCTVPADSTYYTTSNPKIKYNIDNPESLENASKQEAGATISEGTYLILRQGDKAPFNFDIYVQTNETPHKTNDKLFGLYLDDIFKDSNGNSLLYTNQKKFEKDEGKGKFYVTRNGQSISDPSELSELTLGDVLTGKYEICYHPSDTNYNNETKNIFINIITRMAEILGQGSHEHKGLYVDEESGLALDQALAMTRMLFTTVYKSNNSTNDVASQMNQVVKGKRDIYSFSLTNMLKSFLTYYAIALEGQESGFEIIKSSTKESDYATDDMGYYFLVYNNNAFDDQDMLNADFYNMLYNQIATNGACTDAMKRSQVTDKEYLQQAIKNGQLFVSALSSDGYFYQRPYAMLDDCIAEVADEDAIARAEVEYNVTKSKLNAKEETLEMKMKNLDMEISSLTTEFDTVKNLISKNVEKVFTMFSS